MTSTPYYPQIITVRPAAALVANTPYTLSNTATGDVPTATICGLNGRPDIFVGKAATAQSGAGTNYEPGEFWNATFGKNPNDAFATGDTFAVVLQGYPIATLRCTAAITEGVDVGMGASGLVIALPGGALRRLGTTISAQATVGGLVDVLIDTRDSPPLVGTLASLGTAAAAGQGARATVTDASTTLTLGIGTTITGGGANITSAFSNGTNWVYG